MRLVARMKHDASPSYQAEKKRAHHGDVLDAVKLQLVGNAGENPFIDEEALIGELVSRALDRDKRAQGDKSGERDSGVDQRLNQNDRRGNGASGKDQAEEVGAEFAPVGGFGVPNNIFSIHFGLGVKV